MLQALSVSNLFHFYCSNFLWLLNPKINGLTTNLEAKRAYSAVFLYQNQEVADISFISSLYNALSSETLEYCAITDLIFTAFYSLIVILYVFLSNSVLRVSKISDLRSPQNALDAYLKVIPCIFDLRHLKPALISPSVCLFAKFVFFSNTKNHSYDWLSMHSPKQ